MNRREFLASAALGSSIPALRMLGAPVGDGSFENLAVTQYVAESSTPEWWREGGETGGILVRFETETGVRESIELDALEGDRRDVVEEFIAETDFDRSDLLYVESVGPTTAHDRIDVNEGGRRNSKPAVQATVVDTAEEGFLAGPTLTFPSVLVRIDREGKRLDDLVVRVVDGWENEHKGHMPRPGRRQPL